ncbi:hypothetical protein [Streptantibioticus ferralitis]|uniref:UspA domain-containing protein n=1 Tax=Streptantibioticus ferralitis TaxID=236510 RepID=A0ABT5YYJ4_9ACTN|nr:hypothetical protein [Streptantibioticus ferralitis]MDF2256676.1 hypothetical protein [Streptantibioticus ferralitis]
MRLVRSGPGHAPCSIAGHADDLRVIGVGRHGLLTHVGCGTVRHHVLAKAYCPVLVVPAPALRRSALRPARPADFSPDRTGHRGSAA